MRFGGKDPVWANARTTTKAGRLPYGVPEPDKSIGLQEWLPD